MKKNIYAERASNGRCNHWNDREPQIEKERLSMKRYRSSSVTNTMCWTLAWAPKSSIRCHYYFNAFMNTNKAFKYSHRHRHTKATPNEKEKLKKCTNCSLQFRVSPFSWNEEKCNTFDWISEKEREKKTKSGSKVGTTSICHSSELNIHLNIYLIFVLFRLTWRFFPFAFPFSCLVFLRFHFIDGQCWIASALPVRRIDGIIWTVTFFTCQSITMWPGLEFFPFFIRSLHFWIDIMTATAIFSTLKPYEYAMNSADLISDTHTNK